MMKHKIISFSHIYTMATPQVSLPKTMAYGLDYALPSDSKSYSVKIQPSNASSVVGSSYTVPLAAGAVAQDQPFNSQQLYFDFPAGSSPSLFLNPGMTTLNFDCLVELTTAGVAGSYVAGHLRSGAYAWFDTLRVISQNGEIIESIDEFALVNDLMVNLQMNNSVKDSVATAYGFSSESAITNQGHPIETFKTGNEGLTTATKVRYSYSIPLASGVLGVLNDKFLNIGRTSRIQLQLTTASTHPISVVVGASAYTTSPVARFTLGNFSITAEYVDIGMSALRMLDASIPDGIMYAHGTSFRSTSSTLPATTGAVSVLAGIRCSSIKSLFNRFQDLGSLSATNSINSKFDSKCPMLNTINYNIGGMKYPQTPTPVLLSPAQSHIELQKAVGSFNNSAYNSAIPQSAYCKLSAGGTAQGTATGNTQDFNWNLGSAVTSLCQYFYGQNLEIVPNPNILSGLNAISTPIFVELNIATAASNSQTIFTHALIDMVLVHNTRDGSISVRV